MGLFDPIYALRNTHQELEDGQKERYMQHALVHVQNV